MKQPLGDIVLIAGNNELNVQMVPKAVPGADIRLSNLVISPTEVNVGEKVIISVTAKNYGTSSGSKTITLSVDGTTSSQTVTLSPNQSQQLNFEVTPTAAKTYSVSVNGLTGSFKAVAALKLHFSNPQKSATLWDAWALDIATKTYIKSEPSGIKEIAQAKTLKPSTTTFLLWVQEFNPAIPGPYNFGPYLVTIPKFGEYTWDSKAGKIDGISTVNLPLTKNRSFVTGYMSFTPASQYTVATVRIKSLQKADDVTGYRNVAKYFIGKTINVEFADDVPVSPVYGTVPAQEATGYIQLRRTSDNYREEWYGYGWRALKTYPPEAYKFSGSLQLLDPHPGPLGTTYARIQYSISGNVPSFAVVITVNFLTGFYPAYWLVGPTSGVMDIPLYGYSDGTPIYTCTGARMYAHPDPAAEWDSYFWQFYNWQPVG